MAVDNVRRIWKARVLKLRFLEFECDIVHRVHIKQQAAEAMSRLPTGRTEKKKLDDHISLLALKTDMLNTDETKQEQEAWKNYDE